MNKTNKNKTQTWPFIINSPHVALIHLPNSNTAWSRQTKGDVTAAQSSHWHIPHSEHSRITSTSCIAERSTERHVARLGDSNAFQKQQQKNKQTKKTTQ